MEFFLSLNLKNADWDRRREGRDKKEEDKKISERTLLQHVQIGLNVQLRSESVPFPISISTLPLTVNLVVLLLPPPILSLSVLAFWAECAFDTHFEIDSLT